MARRLVAIPPAASGNRVVIVAVAVAVGSSSIAALRAGDRSAGRRRRSPAHSDILAAIAQQLPGADRGHRPQIKAFEAQHASASRAERSPEVSSVSDDAPVVQVVQLHHHPGAARPGIGHPHRAAGRPDPGALPDRRRAARRARPAGSPWVRPSPSRIKIMADMNIVERRRPQDGQISTGARRPQRRHPGRHDRGRSRARRSSCGCWTRAARCYRLDQLGMPGRHDRALHRADPRRRTGW